MQVFLKHPLTKKQQDQVIKAVQSKLKPTDVHKSQLKVTIDGFEITGNYLKSANETFQITDQKETKSPAKKSAKKSTPKADKQRSKQARRSELAKLKKAELIAICKKEKIKYESDNNKSTLIELIIAKSE